MPVVRNIRDLFVGGRDTNPTLRDHANDRVLEDERFALPPENPEWTARMPGDPENHPFQVAQENNPFCGMNPQRVSKVLQSGKLSPELEKKARAWIDQYQKLTGETVHNGRNHDFVEPEITGSNSCGLQRADPWPFE